MATENNEGVVCRECVSSCLLDGVDGQQCVYWTLVSAHWSVYLVYSRDSTLKTANQSVRYDIIMLHKSGTTVQLLLC